MKDGNCTKRTRTKTCWNFAPLAAAESLVQVARPSNPLKMYADAIRYLKAHLKRPPLPTFSRDLPCIRYLFLGERTTPPVVVYYENEFQHYTVYHPPSATWNSGQLTAGTSPSSGTRCTMHYSIVSISNFPRLSKPSQNKHPSRARHPFTAGNRTSVVLSTRQVMQRKEEHVANSRRL